MRHAVTQAASRVHLYCGRKSCVWGKRLLHVVVYVWPAAGVPGMKLGKHTSLCEELTSVQLILLISGSVSDNWIALC